MNLKVQKRLSADIMKCGKRKVWLDPNEITEISNIFSRNKIRIAIKDGLIIKKPVAVHSRHRANKRRIAKSKGRHSGYGKRKGTCTARSNTELLWMQRVRTLRHLLKKYKEKKKINKNFYHSLYMKVKGNTFKNSRVLIEYIYKKKAELDRIKMLRDQGEAYRKRASEARRRRAERIAAKKLGAFCASSENRET